MSEDEQRIRKIVQRRSDALTIHGIHVTEN
jgi:hypothetical protein